MRLVRKMENMQVWDSELQPADGIQADALRNVRTRDNELSFFRLEADDKIIEIVTAASIGSDHATDAYYCVFEASVIENLGFQFLSTPGKTGIRDVDRLHYDLKDLSASRLVTLVSKLIASGTISLMQMNVIKAKAESFVQSGGLTPQKCDLLKRKWKLA